ncbi:Hypothetical Protein FCC1311_024082 [Hondaea fermentalgiana]|uniref:CDAN1-interacting nuclease 1 n=1 Tax=Hondaea fermentalgiana TaxID=2315210 RepID=A0A2R5G575_9STRA|nr:Hypothetical Protein FCC1311_024082 [Hondaea fermentalgiana]|eukprot:GBG26187.1 Hypothetical Protein FCC1311_024082 [Hondaea fermentalgiana]
MKRNNRHSLLARFESTGSLKQAYMQDAELAKTLYLIKTLPVFAMRAQELPDAEQAVLDDILHALLDSDNNDDDDDDDNDDNNHVDDPAAADDARRQDARAVRGPLLRVLHAQLAPAVFREYLSPSRSSVYTLETWRDAARRGTCVDAEREDLLLAAYARLTTRARGVFLARVLADIDAQDAAALRRDESLQHLLLAVQERPPVALLAFILQSCDADLVEAGLQGVYFSPRISKVLSRRSLANDGGARENKDENEHDDPESKLFELVEDIEDMRRADYNKIESRLLKAIAQGSTLEDVISDLDLETWGTSWNAVGSIYSHLYTLYIKRTTPGVRRRLDKLVRSYTQTARRSDRDTIIYELAQSVSFSPFLLARLIVGSICRIAKKELARAMREPEKGIADPILRRNVEFCKAKDTQYSPQHDKYREIAGQEHEYVLSRKLGALRIPFVAEDALRDLGFAKTVDFLLETPIAVYGPEGEVRTIFWIDSKAMFGDPVTHRENMPQLEAYVHRFGPGLVIYWSGFVEDLNVHAEILLAQDMPTLFSSLPRLADSASLSIEIDV